MEKYDDVGHRKLKKKYPRARQQVCNSFTVSLEVLWKCDNGSRASQLTYI